MQIGLAVALFVVWALLNIGPKKRNFLLGRFQFWKPIGKKRLKTLLEKRKLTSLPPPDEIVIVEDEEEIENEIEIEDTESDEDLRLRKRKRQLTKCL